MSGSRIKILEENLKNGLIWKELIKGDYIGGGSYGTVFKYTHSLTAQSYAIKLIPSTTKSNNEKKIKSEIALLNLLSEIPNFSKYFPTFHGFVCFFEETAEGKKTKYYALVSELAKGTLKDYVVHNCLNGLSFQENLTLLECLSIGLSALQEKKISHRDLKPENLLYFSNKNLICFKIIDFGEVKMNVDLNGTVRGAPLYLSPESNFAYLNDIDQINEDYNPFKSDAYSIGLTFLFVNLLKLPFKKDKNMQNPYIKRKNARRYLEKVCNPLNCDKGPYDEIIKEKIDLISKKFENERGIASFKKILEKCLEYNPKKRIDLLELNQEFEVLMIEREAKGPNAMITTLELFKEIEKRDQLIQILKDRNEILMKELDKERTEKESVQKNYDELLELTRREKVRFEEIKSNENICIVNEENEEFNANGFTAFYLEELVNYKNTAKGNDLKMIEFTNVHCSDPNLSDRFIKNMDDLNVFGKFRLLQKLSLNLVNSFMSKSEFFDFCEIITRIKTLTNLHLSFYNDKALVRVKYIGRNLEEAKFLEYSSK